MNLDNPLKNSFYFSTDWSNTWQFVWEWCTNLYLALYSPMYKVNKHSLPKSETMILKLQKERMIIDNCLGWTNSDNLSFFRVSLHPLFSAQDCFIFLKSVCSVDCFCFSFEVNIKKKKKIIVNERNILKKRKKVNFDLQP